MRKVLAIDPSLTRTGVAVLSFPDGKIDGGRLEYLGRFETEGEKNVSNILRVESLVRRLDQFIVEQDPSIVVLEGPSYGSYKSETVHELFAALFVLIREASIVDVLVTPTPSHLKYWVTRMHKVLGFKSKKDVKWRSRDVMQYLFPDNVPSGRKLSHDEAEAALLGVIGYKLILLSEGKEVNLLGFEEELFKSEKSTKTSSRKGLLYRDGEFFFYPEHSASMRIWEKKQCVDIAAMTSEGSKYASKA